MPSPISEPTLVASTMRSRRPPPWAIQFPMTVSEAPAPAGDQRE